MPPDIHMLGRKLSEETKAKMRASRTGRKMSDETKQKLSAAKKGKPNGLQGTTRSAETKQKISQAHQGKKVKPFSADARRNMSEAKKGKAPANLKALHTDQVGRKRPDVTLRQSGANNPSWKGGITPLPKRLRVCQRYQDWRTSIFVRDNYTCQLCGVRGCALEADHYPVRFSDLLRKYNIQTYEQAMLCAPLWYKGKNRTLCVACHKQTPTHAFYGKKRPWEKQMEAIERKATQRLRGLG